MAYRVFRTVETIRGVYYLQRTIDHEGRDYRVFVVGGRVLGAIERRADGWRTNIARGGQAARRPGCRRRGRRSRSAPRRRWAPNTRAWICSRRGTGPAYVLEVNGIPGWQGLQEATGIDVAGALVDHLARRGRDRRARSPRRRSSPACSRSARPSRGTSRPARAFSRHAIRGLPGQRGGDRPGDGGAPATGRSAQPSARRSRPRRRWTRSNTNLGIVLLLAPLARAACPGRAARCATGWRAVLEETTRRGRRGGLRRDPRARARAAWARRSAEDVAAAPTVTLREAMALAAERDAIAREYTTAFALTFEVGAPALPRRATTRASLDRRDGRVLSGAARRGPRHPHRPEARPRGGGARSRRRAREVVAAGATGSAGGPRGAGGLRRASCAIRGTPATRAPPPI